MIRMIPISQIRAHHISGETRIVGNVSRVWGPKKFSETFDFICRSCGWPDSIRSKFPYNEFGDIKCSECRSSNIEQLPMRGEIKTWHKVHIYDNGKLFILQLVGDLTPPKKGQKISFNTRLIPRNNESDAIINTWTGETTGFRLEKNNN